MNKLAKVVLWLAWIGVSVGRCQTGTVETCVDGAAPASGFGDVAWGVAERPAEVGGGFLVVGEHLLDNTVDSHNRTAILLVTDAGGRVDKRIPLDGWTHASKITDVSSPEQARFAIAGNCKGHGASILVVDGDGTVLRTVKGIDPRRDRPTAGAHLIPAADGGFAVACMEGLRGFLVRLDAEFKPMWSTDAVPNLHYIKSVAQAPNGHFYIVGQFGGGKGIHIARWDADGTFVETHVHRIDRSTNKGRRILCNHDGQLVITGMLGSGGRAGFLFLILDPAKLAEPLVSARVEIPDVASTYGQALTQRRDGSYVIGGRASVEGSHQLALVNVDANGSLLGVPRFFGDPDPSSGEAGYDVIETRDGRIAAVGICKTPIREARDITDVGLAADFFLVQTSLAWEKASATPPSGAPR